MSVNIWFCTKVQQPSCQMRLAYLACSLSSVGLWKLADWCTKVPAPVLHPFVPSSSEFRCECSCPTSVDAGPVASSLSPCPSTWPYIFVGVCLGLFLSRLLAFVYYAVLAARFSLAALPGQPSLGATQVRLALESSGPITPALRRHGRQQN